MNRAEPDLGPAFAAAAGASRERAPDHADLEALTAYLHGSLPEADAEALREHLTGCRECGERLLEIEAFQSDVAKAAEDGTQVADLEEAASWRAVRGEIGPERSDGGARTGWRAPGAAAASLAAALIGAVGWGIYQRIEIAELNAPQPDMPLVELIQKGVTRGMDTDVREVPDIPLDSRFALSITPEAPLPGARYQVAIQRPDGTSIWTGELVGDAHGYLTLLLSRRHLSGREYTVRVVPVDESEGEAETFVLLFSR